MLAFLFSKSPATIRTELQSEFDAQQLKELHNAVRGCFYRFSYTDMAFQIRAHDLLESLKKAAIAMGQSQRVEFGDGRALCVTIKRGQVVNVYSEGF